jgi:hypothetical protein
VSLRTVLETEETLEPTPAGFKSFSKLVFKLLRTFALGIGPIPLPQQVWEQLLPIGLQTIRAFTLSLELLS